MIDRNNSGGHGIFGKPESVTCVTVNKIFDSARDKDCLEDLRVFVCERTQEIVDRATAIRTLNVEVADTAIHIEPVPFNRGYFQVNIRFFFCITLECCLCGGKTVVVRGLAAFDKKVILFGSEKNIKTFTSNPENDGFCPHTDIKCKTQPNLPTVVVEAADPIALDTKLIDRCKKHGFCCMSVDAIPDSIRENFDAPFVDDEGTNQIFTTLGLFTLIRMERPVQLMIPAATFSIPERDSSPANASSDPCNVFSKMPFPLGEFFPFTEMTQAEKERGCGKGDKDRDRGCCN